MVFYQSNQKVTKIREIISHVTRAEKPGPAPRMSKKPRIQIPGCTWLQTQVPNAVRAGHTVDEHQRSCWVGFLPHGERGFTQTSMESVLIKARLAGTRSNFSWLIC